MELASEVWHAVKQARSILYALRATWANFGLPEGNMKIKTHHEEWISIGMSIIICIISCVCFPYIMPNKIPIMKGRIYFKKCSLQPTLGCHYTNTFLDAFAELRKATISFVTSVCLSAWNNSAPTRRIFMKFYI